MLLLRPIRIQPFLFLKILLLLFSSVLVSSDDNYANIDIETGILISLDGQGKEGEGPRIWSTQKSCPLGTFVTAYKFNFAQNVEDNKRKIRGIALQCSSLNYWNNFVPVRVIYDGFVSVSSPWTSSTNYKEAVGFGFQKWKDVSSGSEYIENWQLRFAGERPRVTFPFGSTDRIREDTLCPATHVLCGFQTSRNQLLDVVVRLRLICCYHCIPEEFKSVVYDFTNNGVTDVLHTVLKRMGMRTGSSQSVNGKKDKTGSSNPGGTGVYQETHATSNNTGLNNAINAAFAPPAMGAAAPANMLPAAMAPAVQAPQVPAGTAPVTPGPPAIRETNFTLVPQIDKPTVNPDVQPSGQPPPAKARSDMGTWKIWGLSDLYNFVVENTQKYLAPRTTRESGFVQRRRMKQTDMSGAAVAGAAGPDAAFAGAPVPGIIFIRGPDGGFIVADGVDEDGTFFSTPGSLSGTTTPQPMSTGRPRAGTMQGQSQSNSQTQTNTQNIKAKFDWKFGKSKTLSWNWAAQSWVEFTQSMEETDTLTCKALHRCVLKQLVGKCGTFTFDTPVFDYTHIPLRLPEIMISDPMAPDATPSPPPPDVMKVEKKGEMWIVQENVTFSKRSGKWEEAKVCPPGCVVTSQQLKDDPRRGLSLTGMSLQCSKLNSSEKFEPVSVMTSGMGREMMWYNSSNPAVGSTFIQYRMNGMTMKQNFEMRFEGEEPMASVPPAAQDVARMSTNCPENHAICGMQTMFAANGRGEITDMAFKCCHHCNPQEKIIVLESFTNLGYTDTVQTVRRLAGLNIRANDTIRGRNQTQGANNRGGLSVFGMQVGFAAKFNRTLHGGFSWANTSQKFWNAQEEKTLTISCMARHVCVYRQLFGLCNSIEIPTPYTIKESVPIDDPSSLKTVVGSDGKPVPSIYNALLNRTDNIPSSTGGQEQLDPLQMETRPGKKDGEIWIVARNVTFSQGNDVWLDHVDTCPLGSIVTGQRLMRTFGVQFMGLSLQCSSLNSTGQFNPASVISTHNRESREEKNGNWYQAKSPAIGFTFVEYSMNGTRWKGKWEVRFVEDVQFLPLPREAENVSRTQVECPSNYAVCGIQAMVDRQSKDHVRSLTLKCCWYCTPKEKQVVLSFFMNHADVDTTQAIKLIVGSKKVSGPSTMELSSQIGPIRYPIVDPMTLRSAFTTRFNNSDGMRMFDWSETSTSLWIIGEKMEEKMENILCRAQHVCTFRQLVGSCGDIEVQSPYITKEIVSMNAELMPEMQPMNNMSVEFTTTEKLVNVMEKFDQNSFFKLMSAVFQPSKEKDVKKIMKIKHKVKKKFQKPAATLKLMEKESSDEKESVQERKLVEKEGKGEIWIYLEDLSRGEADPKDEMWEEPRHCPPGSIVNAEQFRSHSGSFVSGMNLQCALVNEWDQFIPVKILTSGEGWSQTSWYSSKTPAVGFTQIDFEVSGEVRRAHWEIKFEGKEGQGQAKFGIPQEAKNIIRTEKNCPENFAICGMRTKYRKDEDGQYAILTAIGLKCCFYCLPEEKWVALDSFINEGEPAQVQTVDWVIGTRHVGADRYISSDKRVIDPVGGGEQSTDKELMELLPQINAGDLQNIFTARFHGNYTFNGFDWKNNFMSVWRRQNKRITYDCDGRHLCRFQQLVSTCGDLEFATSHTLKQIVPLHPTNKF